MGSETNPVLFATQIRSHRVAANVNRGNPSTKFCYNVLDTTEGFSLTLTDKADVDGLSASALDVCLGLAQARLKICPVSGRFSSPITATISTHPFDYS